MTNVTHINSCAHMNSSWQMSHTIICVPIWIRHDKCHTHQFVCPYEFVMTNVTHMNSCAHMNWYAMCHTHFTHTYGNVRSNRRLLRTSHVTHMNTSRHTSHIWKSDITHLNESCHTYTSNLSIKQATLANKSCHTYEYLTSHITHLKKPHRTSEWVMSHIHIQLSHQTGDSCTQLMSHIWKNHITHLNKPHQTSERVTSHVWIPHVTHHTSKEVTSHVWTSHVTHTHETLQSIRRPSWNMRPCKIFIFFHPRNFIFPPLKYSFFPPEICSHVRMFPHPWNIISSPLKYSFFLPERGSRKPFFGGIFQERKINLWTFQGENPQYFRGWTNFFT